MNVCAKGMKMEFLKTTGAGIPTDFSSREERLKPKSEESKGLGTRGRVLLTPVPNCHHPQPPRQEQSRRDTGYDRTPPPKYSWCLTSCQKLGELAALLRRLPYHHLVLQVK